MNTYNDNNSYTCQDIYFGLDNLSCVYKLTSEHNGFDIYHQIVKHNSYINPYEIKTRNGNIIDSFLQLNPGFRQLIKEEIQTIKLEQL